MNATEKEEKKGGEKRRKKKASRKKKRRKKKTRLFLSCRSLVVAQPSRLFIVILKCCTRLALGVLPFTQAHRPEGCDLCNGLR